MRALLVLLVACTDDPKPGETGDTGAPGDSGLPLFAGSDLPREGVPGAEPLVDVDVVVVGGGPAGLAAAIEATEAGATVMLVEMKDRTGGSLRYNAGTFLFSGTDIQTESGVADSPDKLLEEWPDFTGGDPADPWVVYFAENNVPEVYTWLTDLGVAFLGGVAQDESGGPTARLHRVDVRSDLANILTDQIDPADILLDTKVTGLRLGPGLRNRGVTIEPTAGGEPSWIRADTIIMATGGFLRNLDMVAEADSALDTSALYFSTGPHADGNGHALLTSVGGVLQNPGAIGFYAHGCPDPRADGEELAFTPVSSTLYINSAGQRFVNEEEYNSFYSGRAVVDQAGSLAWAVFDDGVMSSLQLLDPLIIEGESDEMPTLDDLRDAGFLLQDDSLEGLAAAIGVDGASLTGEVDAYNTEFVEGTEDPWRGGSPVGSPLLAPPYYGLKIAPVLAKAFGGVDVDLQGRVVDADGAPIHGLYAAGELTGMAGGSLVGDAGFTGSLAAVVLGGRVAGQYAAAEALAE